MGGKKQICLALQGGGAYGAFTWGVLDKFLEDDRIIIDSISATSSGSVNAVVLAHALTEGDNEHARKQLLDLWHSISELGEMYSPLRENPIEQMLGLNFTAEFTFQAFNAITRVFSPYLLNPTNFNPLREMLCKKIDFKALNKINKIKIFLCATNVKTGRMRIFKNSEISPDAIMASACLPDIYQAIEIDGEYYWDGGFLGNPAIFPLIYNSDVDDIVIISTNPFIRDSVPSSSAEIANRLNEISFNSSLIRELRAIDFVTKLLDKGYVKEEHQDKVRRKLMHIVRSDEVMNQFKLINKYKWDWDSLTKLRDLGRLVGEQWIATHFNAIGKKSTLDFDAFI